MVKLWVPPSEDGKEKEVEGEDGVEELTHLVPEDWELLGKIEEQTIAEFPDDSPEERELRVEMAVTRHVNQQKVMNYSRLYDVNPMTFLNPTDFNMIRMDLMMGIICPTEEDRIAFELEFEQAVTGYVDAMGIKIARAQAQAMNPDNDGVQVKIDDQGQIQVTGGTRQLRRKRSREMAKLVTTKPTTKG